MNNDEIKQKASEKIQAYKDWGQSFKITPFPSSFLDDFEQKIQCRFIDDDLKNENALRNFQKTLVAIHPYMTKTEAKEEINKRLKPYLDRGFKE